MEAKKLTDLIKIYDDSLSEDLCKKVINFYESHEEHHEVVDRDHRPKFTQFNLTQFVNSGERTAKDLQLHDTITRTLLTTINLYQMDLLTVDELPAQYALEELRIKKYDNNGEDQFDTHVDVGNYNSARRFIACFVYLTDNESEGQTTFPDLGVSVEPKVGRILVFPPLWMYPHAGMPVKDKPKYIIGTYCHYL